MEKPWLWRLISLLVSLRFLLQSEMLMMAMSKNTRTMNINSILQIQTLRFFFKLSFFSPLKLGTFVQIALNDRSQSNARKILIYKIETDEENEPRLNSHYHFCAVINLLMHANSSGTSGGFVTHL